ncbi:ABC transporter permease [Oceanirhabdus sp. W0125-5]|uniref:ABC transporter permease n=1 Tax=Oceanirhabdus sp. W0125-5 TaxID=2999116 RepID=UPI0022F2A9A4|nr:ABC transporter permease [Oceanirhabdus sp. W0125-5]WBW95376.1 ABC transporter permease [Oceanirhabdus sp. W0125-5]
MKDFVRLDFGLSLVLQPKVPITKMLADKIPITVQLNFFSLFLMVPIGMILGVIAALKKNKMTDHVISTMVIMFISVPSFVFAAVMQYFIGFKWHLLPSMIEPVRELTFSKFISMILPILALSFGGIAAIARYLRAELVGALNSEYMLLAKSKGLTQAQATVRHAIRNSFIPLANIIVPMFVTMIGGSMVIERIFGIPGMGKVMIDSINTKDHTVTIALIFVYTLISLLSVLLVDLSYGIIDPRIRIGGRK